MLIKTLFFVLIFTFITTAQTLKKNDYTISGMVYDSRTDLPLVGANIVLENTTRGASSDVTGSFQFKPTGTLSGGYILKVYYVGYLTHSQNVDLPLNENLTLHIALNEDLLNMERIVVTGTRTEQMLKHSPVTVQVIDEKAIEESGSTDLSDVLAVVTGAELQNNGLGTGVKAVRLQGIGSSRVAVLVDGVKMIGRVNGDLDVSRIPASQIERIEIVKGPSSTLYGSDAMGGVINIITKKSKKKLQLFGSVLAGSYGKKDFDLGVGTNYSSGNVLLTGSYQKFDGFDLDLSTVGDDAPSYDKGFVRFSSAYTALKNTNFRMQASFQKEESNVEINPVYNYKILNDNLTAQVGADHKLNEVLELKINTEFAQSNHALDRVVRKSGFVKEGDETKDRLLKSSLVINSDKYEAAAFNLSFNSGYSFEKAYINSDRIVGGKKSTHVQNLFLQTEINWAGKITLLPGIRYDNHSVYGNKVTLKSALMYSPLPNGRLRLSYGEGFRAPSFKELFITYYNSSVNYRISGNENLKPEESKAFGLGLEYWQDAIFHTRINMFYNQFQNLIEYVFVNKVGDSALNYQTANVQRARTWGAEFDQELFLSKKWVFTLGYHFLDSKDNADGEPLALRPKHTLNSRMKYSMDVGDFNLSFVLMGQAFSKKFYWGQKTAEEIQNEKDANPGKTVSSNKKVWINGYSTANCDVGVNYERFTVHTGIKNIFDYVNRVWGPRPGRTFYTSLKFEL